jgi:RHS repeat-associated protein
MINQSLHTKSFAAVRVLRWIAYCGLIGACASSVVWSISLARSDGKSEDKSTGSLTLSPNPPPPLPNQKGRLTSMGNGQKRTAYEYDALGRSTRTVHNFDGQVLALTTAYGYPQNQISVTGLGTVPSSQTFPDNERVDYTYDAGGAQQSIKTTPSGGPQQTIVSSILRNSRGQTISAVYGNNTVTTYGYNDATDLRLNEIKTVAGPQTLQDYIYSFDYVGNITGIADSVTPALNATYRYDSLDQLISMTPAGQPDVTYTYDRIGNLTGKEGVTQTYYTGGLGQGPHALATAGSVSYNYDNNGNLFSTSNGTNITWNPENMPTKVVQSGTTMYQKFFVGENLWKKTEPSGTTYYLPSIRIENGQVRKFFAGFAERSPSPDGTLKFYHGDHLGSASLVTDVTGTAIRRQAYMPYGEDRSVSCNVTPCSFTPKYQFNFKEKEATGFYDYGARLYDPATGRWLSADSNITDGLNRYGYVKNNPLRYLDPTGTQGEEGVWARYYDNVSAYHYHYFQNGQPGKGWETVAAGHTYTDDVGQLTTLNRNGTFSAVFPYTKPASFWAGFLGALASPHDAFAMALGVETHNMRILRQASAANPKTAFAGGVLGSVVGGKLASPRVTTVGYNFGVIGHEAETAAWQGVPFAKVLKVPDKAYSWNLNTNWLDAQESFMRVTAPSNTRYPSVFVQELEHLGEMPPATSVVPKIGSRVVGPR